MPTVLRIKGYRFFFFSLEGSDASEKSRGNWRLIGHGVGVHWPDIDEDIAVGTIMKGHD